MAEWPPVVFFLAGAILLPIVPKAVRSSLFILAPLSALVYLVNLEPGVYARVPFLDYELVLFEVTRLGKLFSIVFCIAATLGGVYAFHLKDTSQQVAALLYSGGAVGVAYAGDMFTVLVFWELMAVGSVWLVWARRSSMSYRAGMRYLNVHLAGGGLLLAGILWRLTETGSLAFATFEPGETYSWLILSGFALNAAIPPLHAWLPDAYPKATITGAVFLSAFTTKTAIYTLARGFAGWDILLPVGVAMALYGVVYAVLANDIRGILAYHIISQVGYMVAGVGIGTEMAINGASAHAFTHILYKGLLFMGAGAVLQATGKRKLTELGGLTKALKWSMYLYMIGAFSISGFPLFSGFVSKSITVAAAGDAGFAWAEKLLHLASVGTFLHTGLKLPYFTWFGPERPHKVEPIPNGMYVAMGCMAALNLGIGLFPGVLYAILPYPISYDPYDPFHVVEMCQVLLFTWLGFWVLRGQLGGHPTVALDTDWLYRKPGRWIGERVVNACVAIYDGTLAGATSLVHGVARTFSDPSALLLGADPNRESTDSEIPIGTSALVVILVVVAVILGLNLTGF